MIKMLVLFITFDPAYTLSFFDTFKFHLKFKCSKKSHDICGIIYEVEKSNL